MKASIYWNYTSRSLLRGGQRTVLAFFCVGVGVMAIVALQLVGLMINNAMTANIRDANGGDINISTSLGGQSFSQSDLSYFDQLRQNGTITNYTAFNSLNASLTNKINVTGGLTFLAVNPSTFPVVTPPTFSSPSHGSISSLLSGSPDSVIVDQQFATTNHKQIGDTFQIHVFPAQLNNAQILTVTIAGIVTDSGVLDSDSGVILIAQSSYQEQTHQTLSFNTIDITTIDQAHTDAAVKDINNQFQTRFLSVQTVADALQQTQSFSDNIQQFLEIAGLLALLIGGVGIVNTMQVLLSRRRVEIAMLKTTGYKRGDLYLLFGLEAGLLGLGGGILGSAVAIGLSYVVRNVVSQVFSLDIPFLVSWSVVIGGVLIGFFTALIFGLLPIVQAANIRPLSVIRELPEQGRAGSIGLTILLLFLLSVLFCIMSIIILNNVGLAIGVVYGTFVFLLILSVFFMLVAFLVSKLPVPERFSLKFLLLILICAVVSGLLTLALPTFGFLLLVLTAVGFFMVIVPRSWKVNTRMALRNIGRQRTRTTTTLLALFVGIFTIGLTLALGQNVSNLLNNAIANVLPFNVITYASGSQASALQSQITTLPGYENSTAVYEGSFAPLAIDGRPLTGILQHVSLYPSGKGDLGKEGTLALLSSMQGYDVANGAVPSSITILAGRNLNASDAGTNNILVPRVLTQQQALQNLLTVGSTITVVSQDGQHQVTLTVVGIYAAGALKFAGSSSAIYGTKDTLTALSPGGQVQESFTLKIDPAKVNQALDKVSQIAPDAISISIADIGDYVTQYLNDIILVLIVVASLSLLAGVIIIANAVALAMLERRRELGILKSVGYTSRTVLGEVLIENATIGGLGALLAMLLVTFITSILGHLTFKSTFSVNGLVVIGLIVGSALLAALTSLLVAWGSVRVRPLEVLRYE